jgi:hypothetical protein
VLVETPIGNLTFEAFADGVPLCAPVVSFRSGHVEPALPSGMSVAGSVGVLVALEPEITLQGVRIRATWEGAAGAVVSPTSGERLDAQEWVGQGHIVVLGTEDGEALADRLVEHGLRLDPYPVHYSPLGLEVVLPQVPAGSATTLHFVVAVNTHPEPVDCSAWFAADVPHERMYMLLGGT